MTKFSLPLLLCLLILLSLPPTSTASPPLSTLNQGADIDTPEYATPTSLNPPIGPQQHTNSTELNHSHSTPIDKSHINTDTTTDTDQFEPSTLSTDSTQPTMPDSDIDPTAHDSTRPPSEEPAEDAEILSEMRARVERLLERQRALDEQLAVTHRHRISATSLRSSSTRYPSRGRLATVSRERDARLASLRAELPVYFENLRELVEEAEHGQREISRLRAEKRHLLLLQRRLVDEFRSRGLEHWIQEALEMAAPIVGRGGQEYVGKEMDGDGGVDGGRGFAFYSGIFSYVVVLLPVVLVASVVVRVRKRLRMGLGHWIVLGNVYFGVLSVGCFFASQFGNFDVLVTIQGHRVHFYKVALLAHGVVYTLHVMCHVMYALSARTGLIALHAVGVSAVGVHFYMHSYRHALRGEASDVDARAYFMYAVVFFYILFELVFRKVISAALTARSKQHLSVLQRVRGVFQRAVTPRAKLIHPIPGGEALLSNSKQHINNGSAGNGTQGDSSSAGVMGNELRPCIPGGGLGSNAAAASVGVEIGEAENTAAMIRSSGVSRLGVVSGEAHARPDLEAAKTL